MNDKLARFYPLRTAVRKPAISTGKLTAALIGLAMITPYATVAGATCLALPLAYAMIVRPGVRSFKQNSFLNKHPDHLAHLVPSEMQMIDYLKAVGRDKAVEQVERAFRHGVDLTGPAKMLLAKYASHFDPKQLGEYLEGLDKTKPFKSADGTITVNGERVDDSAQGNKSKLTTVVNTAIEKITKDVVTAFLEDLRCTFLCAPPRAGKGVVATAMMIGFKQQYPAGVLFSCTIKQFAGEDWYFNPSDYHINPSVDDPIELATQIYNLYLAWESSASKAEAPSLFVFDELRDTLLALKNIELKEIAPDTKSTEKFFADWLKGKIISAATLNQCHKRYLLLIAPCSSAAGIGFKDANSLKSYASYTLVTPSELAFTEGNNGTFGTPAIGADSPLFKDWYGLAWGSKGKEWLGVPKVGADVIAYRESQPTKLNYFAPPTKRFEDVFPAQMLASLVKDTDTLDRKIADLTNSTVSKAPAKVAPDLSDCEVTDEDEFMDVFGAALDAIRDADEPVKLTDLVANRYTRKRYTDRLIAELSNVPNVEYSFRKSGNVTSHLFAWVCDDTVKLSWDELEEDN
jgi:hypothetical protein